MWHNEKVSVILILKDNASTIRAVVEDLFYTGYVDEILAVDLGSKDRTVSELSYTKARISTASSFHEGFSRAVERVSGDIIILGDPEGLIPAGALVHLLGFASSYDAVFSSRTSWIGGDASPGDKHYIASHTQLGRKMMRYFGLPKIDDLNSRLVLARKEALHGFSFELEEDLFIFELFINTLQKQLRFIQVPVEFHAELGIVDSSFFTLPRRLKMNSMLNKLKKGVEKRSSHSSKVHRLTTHLTDSRNIPVDEEEINPLWVKRRIAALRKRLNDIDKPDISEQTRKELNDAVSKVIGGEIEPVQEETPEPQKAKKLSIEEEYRMLEKLDAGLHSVKKKRKKASKKRSD
ncbi:MAG: glycosyltransferase family 2 protein [Nanoarchaeota archaeon]